jgi:hypothetical protein
VRDRFPWADDSCRKYIYDSFDSSRVCSKNCIRDPPNACDREGRKEAMMSASLIRYPLRCYSQSRSCWRYCLNAQYEQLFCTTFYYFFSERHLSSDLDTRQNSAEIAPGINHYHHVRDESKETKTVCREGEDAFSFSDDASVQDASGGSHVQRRARLFGPNFRR